MATLVLEVIESDNVPRQLTIARPLTTFGRSSGCDVRVVADVASSHHARLKLSGDGATIEDLNSTNGVFVNGERVAGPTYVGQGDEVELGSGGPVIRIIRGPTVGNRSQRSQSIRYGDSVANRRPLSAQGQASSRVLVAFAVVTILVLFLVGLAVVTFVLNASKPAAVSASLQDGTNSPRTKSGNEPSTRLSDASAEIESKSQNGRGTGGGDLELAISSIHDENRIAQAVGLVILGTRVQIDGRYKEIPIATGTAFAISSDGALLTNRHVVSMPPELKIKPKVWVVMAEKFFDAEVTYVSPDDHFDLAILKINRIDSPYFKLSSATELPRLSKVFALGFPGASMTHQLSWEDIEKAIQTATRVNIEQFFEESDLKFTSTDGTISKWGRRSFEGELDAVWIQHRAGISPGNSGGPLCLEDGVVVGINTLRSPEDESMEFAFAVHQLRSELKGRTSTQTWK